MVHFDTSENQEPVKDPTLRPLWDDMVECERMLKKEDSQFARRTFCRAAFAFIEGQTCVFRGLAVKMVLNSGWSSREVDMPLVSALLEQSPRVGKNGKVTIERAKVPFINSLAAVYRAMAECLNLNTDDFFGVSEWEGLQKAIKVRHRITHPKTPEDLVICDEDMSNIRNGLCWSFNAALKIANCATDLNAKGPNNTP